MTTRHGTTAVTQGKSPALCLVETTRFASQVQQFAGGAQDRRQQIGVACHAPDVCCGDWSSVGGDSRIIQLSQQALVADEYADLHMHAAGFTDIGTREHSRTGCYDGIE